MMRVLGSTWFAITLLVLIFLYSSVGSAVPPVRQGAMADWLGWEALRFEMTEMEWFCSPVFVVMVGLFCLSMIVATIRRIPLNMPRLGEWVVHLGVLVMVVGCVIYFGRKVEGDAVVYQRSALVSAPGVNAPVKMVIRPNASVNMVAGNERYRISIARIVPRYTVPVGPQAGQQTTAVWFSVQRAGAAEPRRFTRVAMVGYPSLTADVADGDTNARPSGQGLLDTNLRIDIDYEPQDTFFLEHTAAIYARIDPHADWIQMPIRKLPRYYEHVSNDGDIWPGADSRQLPLRPIDIAVAPRGSSPSNAKTLEGITFRVVGYLPYAQLDSHAAAGGERLNPVVRFSLFDGQNPRTYELAAFDPMRDHIDFDNSQFRLEFRWAASTDEREQLAARHKPRLEFRIAGRETPIELPLAGLLDKGPQAVPGTDYRVTVASSDVMLNFPLMGDAMRGKTDNVAVVSVERGEKKFRRLVFSQNPDQSRDVSEMHTPLPELADRDLQIRFVDPAPAGMRLIAGPTEKDCEVVINSLDGEQTRHALPVGQTASAANRSIPLTIDAIIPKAIQVARPALVPRNQRQPLQSVGAAMSLVNVEVNDGKASHRVWLPFNQYAFPDATYAYPERFQYGSYMPETVSLSDGRTLELMYSRERHYLPASIALERFVLETHPGGQRERDFISQIRFYENNHWSPVREVRSNQPGQYGGLWFFQSEWDPKHEAMTVLGVGNREGIGVMLAGVMLSILGMIYSFYVKPIALRRRMTRDAAALASEGMDTPRTTTPEAPPQSQKKKRASAATRVGLVATMATILAAGGTVRAEPSGFQRDVDLSQIRLIAVQHDGRFKPFDTLAREIVQQITGSSFFDGQDPIFTYLDLMLNPAAYSGRNLILVKKARVREALIKAAGNELSEADGSYIRQTKRVSPRFLAMPSVQHELEVLESDTMNTGRDVDLIRTAQAYADSRNLRGFLAIVPPPGGTPNAPWLGIDEIAGSPALASLDPALRSEIASSWTRLETGWRAGDAKGTGEALNTLAASLVKVEPRLYPDRSRLAMEHRYFEHKAWTGVWFIYLAALVCLLPAFLARNNTARRIGMLAFVVAFAMQTVSIGIRWYLARRIPTANMFEAVTAAAWSGAAIALILEVWLRRRPMRNLFALGASFCAALALMCGYFMPTLLSANISNPMPILNTVWLKIHVTLILVSYVLIGVSFVTATLYLALRAAARLSSSGRLIEMWAGSATTDAGKGRRAPLPDGDSVSILPFGAALAGPPATPGSTAVCSAAWSSSTITGTVLSVAGAFVLALLLRGEIVRTAAGVAASATAGAIVGRGLYLVLLAATVALGPAFVIWLLTGTARIILGRDDATQQGLRAPLAAVLDGSTMLLIEAAFVTLWIGIILGAAWADVSWGRPWGWDPKEVFALNTWLIFVGLIHIRLNVSDKGLWTAILAVAGFAVMMFNWVGVNYFIVGLHSYA